MFTPIYKTNIVGQCALHLVLVRRQSLVEHALTATTFYFTDKRSEGKVGKESAKL